MRPKEIGKEFSHHFPFTVFSTALGLVVVVFLTVLLKARDAQGSPVYFRQLFHLFHPLHILMSAIATTAMMWRFDRKVVKAVLVGLVGSLGICGLSDIFLPWLGGLLIGSHMHLHVCIIEHPHVVVPFALLGIVTGFLVADRFPDRTSTIFSHSSHVLTSTMASLFYFVSFGFLLSAENAFVLFILVLLAVIIPCCTSDIFFPLLTVRAKDHHH
ncbi:MAG: hypothetical protein JSV84_01345 [Gemmatimonadota bacterium]|nr:MAG: hypothetical protein JSV84_01345 [Gemmatimonadota bacterium]